MYIKIRHYGKYHLKCTEQILDFRWLQILQSERKQSWIEMKKSSITCQGQSEVYIFLALFKRKMINGNHKQISFCLGFFKENKNK